MNFTKQLGKLAFGTRLRLLTDKFMQDAVKIYQLRGLDFEPRWFTLFYLIYSKSPLSISEITAELGYTQPAVTQIANILIKKKLLKIVKDKKDSRRKLLILSPKAEAMIPLLQPIWKGFEEAVNELFNEINCNMLDEIEKMESALSKTDMPSRVLNKIKQLQKTQTNNV